jgi:RNA polymerase sigma-70 factor (ECF subfamily)
VFGEGDLPHPHDSSDVAEPPRQRYQRVPPAEPPPAAGDERLLVDAVLRKDRKAAAQFVAAHVDAVYGFVRHRLVPRADLVDDVVQDVFLAALKALASFQGTSSLRTWLIGIARHKVDDVYRRQLRAPDALADLESAGDEPPTDDPPMEDIVDTARARLKTRAVLARMPERYGVLLMWRYWERRSTREIAEAIGTTEKSVERMLARARARFRELWLKE